MQGLSLLPLHCICSLLPGAVSLVLVHCVMGVGSLGD